jgi:hypothetical protein
MSEKTDTNPAALDLTEDKGYVLGETILYKVVCVPKTWSDAMIEAFAGISGTSAGWVISESDPDIFDGKVRDQCPDEESCVHVLLNC